MTRLEALEWLKLRGDASYTELARVLGITQSAVSQWGEEIPELQQRKLVELSAGYLRLDRKYLLAVK
jgi:DNA-binding transcriptional ArsR family regulator